MANKLDKINKETLDMGVQNPNKVEEIDERTSEQIISEIEELDKETNQILNSIKVNKMKTKLSKICTIDWGNTSLTKKSYQKDGKFSCFCKRMRWAN